WKIEESFRFQKTELVLESLRLREWEPRRKMLLLVTLAYGFLLSMLVPPLWLARSRLLDNWCQRADWRLWTAKAPLYRLRWALSRLWLTHPPQFLAASPLARSPMSPGPPVLYAGGSLFGINADICSKTLLC